MDKAIQIIERNGKNVVEINTILFSGKRNIDWNGVEKYLKNYVGEQYRNDELEDFVHISSDFPDEYAHSRYSTKAHGAIGKAKANAIQAVPELIHTATNIVYYPNLEEKHRKDAPNGWYRCTVFFSIPICDSNKNVIGNNLFRGRMIIRCDQKKKLHLYDIIDIKKET